MQKSTSVWAKHVQSGQHICWIFESLNDYTSVMTSFIENGIRGNEKVIYIFDPKKDFAEETNRLVSKIMDRVSIKHNQYENYSTEEVYFRDNNFDPLRVTQWVKDQARLAIEEGFSGVRITGEMTWILNIVHKTDLLLEYEAGMIDLIQDSKIVILCQYRKSDFPPALLNKILDTHPQAIIGTKFAENVYFTSPRLFLGPNREKALLDKKIENICLMNTKMEERAETQSILETNVNNHIQELFLSLAHFETLFNTAPIPIWEEDCSKLFRFITSQNQNPENCENITNNYPELLNNSNFRLSVLNANLSAKNLFDVNSLEDFELKITDVFRQVPILTANICAAIKRKELVYQGTDYSVMINGRPFIFDIRISVFPGHESDYSRVAVFLYDVTERNKALTQLRLSEALLVEAQELTRLGSIEFNSQNGNWICSDEMIRILERDRGKKELTQDEILSHVHPEERDLLKSKLSEALTENHPVQYECRIISLRGVTKYGLLTVKNYTDPLTSTQRVFGTLLDISELKEISWKLARSEDKYKKLIDNSISAVVMTDEEGKIAEWNRSAEEIIGFEKKEVAGKYIWDIKCLLSDVNDDCDQIRENQKIIIGKILNGEGAIFDRKPYLTKIRRPDDSIREIITNVYSIKTDRGYIVCFISNDVTEQNRDQKSLMEREERYRLLSEVSADCAYTLIIDDSGYVTSEWTTETYSRIIGWKFDELEKRGSYPAIVHPDDKSIYFKIREQSMEGKVCSGEYRIITSNGEINWIKDLRKPVWDESANRVIKVHGAISKITERKIAELAIQDSEIRHRELFETMPDGVIFFDPQGKITSANMAAQQILGRQLDQLVFSDYFEKNNPVIDEGGLHPEFYELPLFIALRTGLPVRDVLLGLYNNIDQKYRWVIVSAIPQFRPDEKSPYGVYVTLHDITQMKEINQSLEESEHRFRSLIEKSPIAIGITRNGNFIYANDQYLKMFGIEGLDEILGTSVLNQTALEDWDGIRKRIENRKIGSIIYDEFEAGGIRKDGSRFPFFAAVTEVSLPDGPALFGYFLDITDRKQAEQALQETNRVLSTLIEASPLAIVGLDLNKRITLWTPSAEKLFGWKSEEVIGKELPAIPPALKEGFNAKFIESLASKPLMNFETRGVHKNGSLMDISVSNSVLHDADGERTGVMYVLVDIRERKRTEKDLEKSLVQLHALTAQLVTIREEERTKISREIHDELGQNLTGIKIDLFSINKQIGKYAEGKSKQVIQSKIGDMIKLVDTTSNAIRRIATELRPSVLDNLGLVPAIEWLAMDFQTRTGIGCVFHSSLGDLTIRSDVSTSLFRVCQEALTNVMRHANASQVVIILSYASGVIQLTIEDNGKGISEDIIHHNQSLGMIGMRERIFSLGGEFIVEAKEPGGTRLKAVIPF